MANQTSVNRLNQSGTDDNKQTNITKDMREFQNGSRLQLMDNLKLTQKNKLFSVLASVPPVIRGVFQKADYATQLGKLTHQLIHNVAATYWQCCYNAGCQLGS